MELRSCELTRKSIPYLIDKHIDDIGAMKSILNTCLFGLMTFVFNFAFVVQQI